MLSQKRIGVVSITSLRMGPMKGILCQNPESCL